MRFNSMSPDRSDTATKFPNAGPIYPVMPDKRVRPALAGLVGVRT